MTPQEEKDLLLRVVTQIATLQLQQGNWRPFGALLGAKREVQLVMHEGMEQDFDADEIEAEWARELRESVKKGTAACKAVSYCAHVRVPLKSGGTAPAISIHLEHADADAEDLLYSYQRSTDAKIMLGEPTRVPAGRQIFVS